MIGNLNHFTLTYTIQKYYKFLEPAEVYEEKFQL